MHSLTQEHQPETASAVHQDRFISHKELADLMGTTPNCLYALYSYRRPYLPPRYKIGRRSAYKLSEVMAALERCKQSMSADQVAQEAA